MLLNRGSLVAPLTWSRFDFASLNKLCSPGVRGCCRLGRRRRMSFLLAQMQVVRRVTHQAVDGVAPMVGYAAAGIAS